MPLGIALGVITVTVLSGCSVVLADWPAEHDCELRAKLANFEPVAPRESEDGKHQPVVHK